MLEGLSRGAIIGIVLGVVLSVTMSILAIIFILFYLVKCKKHVSETPLHVKKEDVNQISWGSLKLIDWQIDYSQIKLHKQIGEGEFGLVFQGEWRGITVGNP